VITFCEIVNFVGEGHSAGVSQQGEGDTGDKAQVATWPDVTSMRYKGCKTRRKKEKKQKSNELLTAWSPG
jgi:hypothetical protein